jgi:hypothetical protein
MLLLNLNIADLLLGITYLVPSVIYLAMSKSLHKDTPVAYNSMYSLLQNNSKNLVLVIYVPIVTAMMVSTLTLTALALKKYTNILYPFVYIRLTTDNFKKSFLVAVLVIWTTAVLMCVLPFLVSINPSQSHVFKCRHAHKVDCMFHRVFQFENFMVFVAVCALCGFIILILYVRIYLLAHREYNKFVSLKNSSQHGNRDSEEQDDVCEVNRVVTMWKWRVQTSPEATKTRLRLLTRPIQVETKYRMYFYKFIYIF